ncbi:MAG: hypothetical protein BWY32_02909 [bacterium ADurb.Bin243]|nr:MAG: hypothetical protein BWY32_02909 [bacterium ADurb.Bin243]
MKKEKDGTEKGKPTVEVAGGLENSLANFTVARLGFELGAISDIKLNEFSGSSIRGVMGRGLKTSCCRFGDMDQDCRGCLMSNDCCYRYVFETPVEQCSEIMKKYTMAPHPFVMVLPDGGGGVVPANGDFSFGLTLIGRAINYIDKYIECVERMGRIGFGAYEPKGRFILKNVVSISHTGRRKYVYRDGMESVNLKPYLINFKRNILGKPGPSEKADGGVRRVRVSFKTPVRIQFEENIARKIDFHMIVRNLLRRVFHLNYFHVEGEKAELDFNNMIDAACEVRTVASEFKPYMVTRYSNRQKRSHEFRGVTGDAVYEGENIGRFMPLLRLGQYINVGKTTAFGMGRYELI